MNLHCKPHLSLAQDVQDIALQIWQEGYHNASDLLFHLIPQPEDKVSKLSMPQVMCASRFAAQLVTHKLGAAAGRHLLSWLGSSPPWQAARRYWLERLTHEALSEGGDFAFRLVGQS